MARQSRRKQQQTLRRLATSLAACLVMIAATAFIAWKLWSAPANAGADNVPVSRTTGTTYVEPTPTPEPTPEPTADPAEGRIAEAMATAGSNATKDAPQVTDPATWNDAGRALMERLAADPYYADFEMTLDATEGYPYLLAVNRAASTVTVYTTDENNQYTVPFMAMVCSGGEDTPTGYWFTPVSYDWRLLAGPSYGQYATRIYDSYLFHTVPYYSQHKDDLEYDQFNQLGTLASLGCIRLAVVDVKWIYDNCPIGTPVVIYDLPDDPGPMGKPGTIYTDPANPWDDAYLTGTAIRSQAAWDQWYAEQENWAASLTPTDLQGYSTDSSIEGTRG